VNFVDEYKLRQFDTRATDEKPINVLPPGWLPLHNTVQEACAYLNGLIQSVRRDDRGLLRIEYSAVDFTSSDLLRRICETITRDSAVTCMVCGKRGFRRKLESGWPCLCRDHYIIYANALNEGV
jgi:hypothetical protein